jgi:hypothetical protein
MTFPPQMTTARCIQSANAMLGEGQSWDAVVGTLYWVDIKRSAIFRFDLQLGQTGQIPCGPPGWLAVIPFRLPRSSRRPIQFRSPTSIPPEIPDADHDEPSGVAAKSNSTRKAS